MIECKLRKRPEFLNAPSYNPTLLKEGKYHGSNFHLEEKDKYVVGVYIDFDFKRWIGSNLGEQEIIKECIDYLNVIITPKKRNGKRLKKPYYKYGVLSSYDCKIVRDETNNSFYISGLLLTNDPENKHFFGEGLRSQTVRKRPEKRGRPRKKR